MSHEYLELFRRVNKKTILHGMGDWNGRGAGIKRDTASIARSW
jgi:hypothetical protein